MSIESQSDVRAALEFAKANVQPVILNLSSPTGEGAPALVLPAGLQAHSVKPFFDAYRSKPERRKGIASFSVVASLIEHVNRFKDEDSALFASEGNLEASKNPTITAVLDYHRKGAAGDPRFGEHRAAYAFPFSDEWKAWNNVDGEELDQQSFAALLEDRALDLTAPPTDESDPALQIAKALGARYAGPQKLMELAGGLSINEGRKVKQFHDASSGAARLAFETEHTDEFGNPMDIPKLFLITIPVFKERPAYRIPVRLRYRISGSKVVWFVELFQADRAFKDSFQETCKDVAAKTGLPLFYGTPE